LARLQIFFITLYNKYGGNFIQHSCSLKEQSNIIADIFNFLQKEILLSIFLLLVSFNDTTKLLDNPELHFFLLDCALQMSERRICTIYFNNKLTLPNINFENSYPHVKSKMIAKNIQGVSEIRVLLLNSGRTRQIMKLFSITSCKIRKSFPRFLPTGSFCVIN
jgi:hypothetical protein